MNLRIKRELHSISRQLHASGNIRAARQVSSLLTEKKAVFGADAELDHYLDMLKGQASKGDLKGFMRSYKELGVLVSKLVK